MRAQSARRVLIPGALVVLGVTSILGVSPAPASAVSVVVPPARTIAVTSSASTMAVTDTGAIFTGNSTLQEWAPDSVGAPDVVKSWTGMNIAGTPSYLASAGIAFADGTAKAVEVMDPSQASGAYVATRTISGAATMIDAPVDVAWASDGSLWVVDSQVAGSPGYEFLRFAPGANGNVAPVQRISGNKTGFVYAGSTGVYGQPFIAALPGHGLAVSAAGVRPSVSIFTGSQQGNVAPAHVATMVTPAPRYLSEGIAADAAGRIYLSAGDPDGATYGVLDVFSATGGTLLTMSGAAQGLAVALAPAVSPNGTLAVLDATIFDIGSTDNVSARVEVYHPLFARPSAVRSLKVTTSKTTQTVTWKAPSNPGGTPASYRVVVKKGTRTLVSRTLTGGRLVVLRRSLPKGSLKVTVAAVDVGGSGPAVTRSFHN